MVDPLKTATREQFPILNGLSKDQIIDIATSSSFYQFFHSEGYSDAWIAADVLAWQRLQQKIKLTLPIVIAAISIVPFMKWRVQFTPVFHLMFCTDATWGKGSQAAICPYVRAETLTPKGF